jgi:hypothetical protein
MSKPHRNPDYITINTAAEILGKSKGFVKRAVERGLLRSTSEPFKSNLNPESLSNRVLISSQDIRLAIKGDIDLTVLDEMVAPSRKELPDDLVSLATMVVELTQTTEQLAVMVTEVLKRMAAPAVKHAASRKEVPIV